MKALSVNFTFLLEAAAAKCPPSDEVTLGVAMSLGELTWALTIQLPWDNNPLTCGSTLLKGYTVGRVLAHILESRGATMKMIAARKFIGFSLCSYVPRV